MGIFDEIMTIDESVFKNPDVFNVDYMPEIIQCRDAQLKSILINVTPALENNKPLNTLIMGNASSGKTTVLKQALKDIDEETELKTCYLNCNIQNTARKCYFQIYKVLFNHEARQNISTEIVQKEIMTELEEKILILGIDDINHLNKKEASTIINELFRASEFYRAKIGLFITMNDILFRYSLERNAQSVLLGQEIEFKDYTTKEIYKILKYRCDVGFRPGIITDEQIMRISTYCATYSNLRKGLSILNILGKTLVTEDRECVTDKDIRKLISV